MRSTASLETSFFSTSSDSSARTRSESDGLRLAVMVSVVVVGAAHDVLLAGAAGSR